MEDQPQTREGIRQNGCATRRSVTGKNGTEGICQQAEFGKILEELPQMIAILQMMNVMNASGQQPISYFSSMPSLLSSSPSIPASKRSRLD